MYQRTSRRIIGLLIYASIGLSIGGCIQGINAGTVWKGKKLFYYIFINNSPKEEVRRFSVFPIEDKGLAKKVDE